ncbi:hypothetical protein ACIBG8_52550 [Nonomuraea sp. NPDC050556]|uniref:hypothetical protein n=1 Tax=Nonomuraea sp. NPDC050556 TaxID=3364369 RepID=UPI0037BDD844
MGLWSRLFRRGDGDPLADRERELREAHRQGVRDARSHALGEFTDPDVQPAYVSAVRAWAKERIALLDQQLEETRTELAREAGGAHEVITRETSRPELFALPAVPPSEESEGDAFISIGESRRRRAAKERREASRAAGDAVLRARARIDRLKQEWDSVLVGRNHAVDAIHARAEQRIAAYRAGVMQAHPRREEIVALWKGEVVAMDSTMDSPAAIAGRESFGRLLGDADLRIEAWSAGRHAVPELDEPARRELPRVAASGEDGAQQPEERLVRPDDFEDGPWKNGEQAGNGRAGGWVAGSRDGE